VVGLILSLVARSALLVMISRVTSALKVSSGPSGCWRDFAGRPVI
jgi:hypothetical protein